MIDSLFKIVENFLDEFLAGHTKTKDGFEHINNVTSKRNTGLSFDGSDKLQDIALSCRNALIVGSTGSGKSSIYSIVNLVMNRGLASYVVLDPSAEIANLCAPLLAQRGYRIKILNFTNPKESNFYCPLKRLDLSYSSCKLLANILVKSTLGNGQGNEIFWNSSANNIISIFLYITKRLAPEHQHLASTLQLINGFSEGNKKVDELAAIHCVNPTIWAEYKAIKAIDQRLMQNILATAKTVLSIIQDEHIAYLTSKDEINFEDLRKTPTVIFIQANSLKTSYLSPIISPFLTQLFQFLLDKIPENEDLHTFFLLDEIANFCYIPDFESILSVNRKFKISISVLLQNTSQLNHRYGERAAEIIKGNLNSALYYSNQDMATCKKLSEIAGYHLIENEYGKKIKEPVMTADEIRTMSSGSALLILPGSRPVYIDTLTPYYKNEKLMHLIKSAPPFSFQRSDTYTGVTPMLNLN